MSFDLSNYVDVAERVQMLKAKYPEAVLRPFNPAEPFKVMEIGGREFIVYTAACYRTPDDPTPAIAVAAEPAVGKTPYTRDSEVMNAETSAWGRAIYAALACETSKVASLEEVRNRRAEQQTPQAPQAQSFAPRTTQAPRPTVVADSDNPRLASEKQVSLINKMGGEVHGDGLKQELYDFCGKETPESLTVKEASGFIKRLMEQTGR